MCSIINNILVKIGFFSSKFTRNITSKIKVSVIIHKLRENIYSKYVVRKNETRYYPYFLEILIFNICKLNLYREYLYV